MKIKYWNENQEPKVRVINNQCEIMAIDSKFEFWEYL